MLSHFAAVPSDVVVFDLETSGMNHQTRHRGVEIVSIGAVDLAVGNTFEKFVLPRRPISASASNTHGLFKQGGRLVDSGECKTPSSQILKIYRSK